MSALVSQLLIKTLNLYSMDKPKVSVCITTYNVAPYIGQTLDSVLVQQAPFGFEVLVGDDCSTDGTQEILLDYYRRYPDIVRLNFQKKNVGVNRQDYDLINMARGEYIAWLDGDDYWIDKDKLAKQATILDTNPNFSCVHTSWRNYNEAEESNEDRHIKEGTWVCKIKGKEFVERLLNRESGGIRLSSVMYRRQIVVDFIQKDPSIYLTVPHVQNDIAIFSILGLWGPFYCLNEITTVYRIRRESLSATANLEKRTKYSIADLYVTAYVLNYIDADAIFVQQIIRRKLSGLLLYIYILGYKYEQINVVVDLCKSVNYKFRIGQKLLLASVRYRWLRPLLYPIVKSKVSE